MSTVGVREAWLHEEFEPATVELGVSVLLDTEMFGWARAGDAERARSSARADLMRAQRERWLAECRSLFAAGCAEASHARLTAAAVEGRANPARPLGDPLCELILDGAYVVRADAAAGFVAELAALEAAYAADGVRFELSDLSA